MSETINSGAFSEAVGRALDRSVFGASPAMDRMDHPPTTFEKNSIAIRIDQEAAMDFGLVDPSREYLARTTASAERYRQRDAERQQELAAMWSALLEIDMGVTNAMCDLHSPDEQMNCSGCDYQGYEADPIEWPCRTIVTLAEVHGIEVPA